MAVHRKRRFWILGALGLLAVALVAWVLFHKPPAKPTKVPSIPVTAVKAATEDGPGERQAHQRQFRRRVSR
jgi:hypothetical protein